MYYYINYLKKCIYFIIIIYLILKNITKLFVINVYNPKFLIYNIRLFFVLYIKLYLMENVNFDTF